MTVAIAGERLGTLSSGDLAGHLWMRHTVESGVAFARNQDRPQKDAARKEVLKTFGPTAFPDGLSLFTMPGLFWKFERSLIHRREQRSLRRERGPRRTYFCSIECDEAIYRASFKYLPGASGYGDSHLVVLSNTPPCATAGVRTRLIERYFRCSFEDYAEMPMDGPEPHRHGGAWLDFNGPLTTRRLAAIVRFWNLRLLSTLVVTAMNARTDREMSDLVSSAGGAASLLLASLPDARLTNSITYNDTTPMFQATFVRGAA